MLIRIIVAIARAIVKLIANVKTVNFDSLPDTGGVIVVTNHLGRLDAVLGVLLVKRRDVIIMIAEKYENHPLWGFLGKQLDAVWLNRSEADFKAMRQVFQRLRQGNMLAIAPEGTRSKTEALAQGKPGAAYLAAKSGLPIYPIGLCGTEDRLLKGVLKSRRRLDVTVRVGEPFTLPPIPRADRDAFLAEQTDEIMCRIAALVPSKYRGLYANHPRLHELLAADSAD